MRLTKLYEKLEKKNISGSQVFNIIKFLKKGNPVYNPRTLCVIGVLTMNLFSYNVGQLLNMELYVTHCEKLVL